MQPNFRRLTRADIPLMHRWLNVPEVSKWWEGPYTFEQVEHEFGEYIDGVEPIHPYLALDGERPIGHLQWMQYKSYPDYAQKLGIRDLDAANCDVFIGDEDYLHRGIGASLIRTFVDEIIFADPTVPRCYIDPDPANTIAIRAYEKAGFTFLRRIDDVYLMMRERG